MKKSYLLLIIGVALAIVTSCKKKDPVVPPVPVTPVGGEVQAMPYTQSFATEFGTYCIKNVLGDQEWIIDYQTAKMTGHTSSGNFENEDWLISSPVNIQGVEHAKAVVNYVAQYQAPNDDDITFMVSENYTFNNMPATAEWAQMSVTFPNTTQGDWHDFQDKEVNLDAYIGKTVTVAIKFTSTTEKSRTMEVKSITVMAGQAGGDTPTPPTPPGPGTGSGTVDDPYNVASGISQQNQNPYVIGWVKGYIVGAVKSGVSSISSNDDINWSEPFDLNTNVIIADDANCREISQCVIVNLPNNKPLRTQVNLVDNPGNLGKQLAVNGKLRTYFGKAGLRDSEGTVNDFVLEGVTPPTPPTPGTEIFSETFASGQGEFTIQNVLLSGELTYVWSYASNYSCMKASAYVGQAYETESWLVSPTIDLTGATAPRMNFSQAVNYASPDGALFMMISTDYTDDVTTANWTEIAIDQWPAGNNWTFITSNADLTDYAGQYVNIAFKYTSTNSAATTWEVKNFVVEE